MPKGRTREVSKRAYRTYFRKASDFARLASAAMDSNNFNGAGLAATHSVISSCDAVCAFYLGVRSAADQHDEVAEILKTIHLEGSDEKMRQVRDVLQLKNLVEYEDRETSREEAVRLAAQATRILTWARKSLPEP